MIATAALALALVGVGTAHAPASPRAAAGALALALVGVGTARAPASPRSAAGALAPGALAATSPAAGARARPAPKLEVPRPPAPAPQAPPADVSHLHDELDAVLRANVRNGVPDWEALRRRDLPRLQTYLDRMARVDSATLPPAERTAFGLNLYNATFLAAAAPLARAGWTPADANFAIFRAPLVRTPAGSISLDSLERGVIRPAARDPRVHVALWCGARSCPPLLARAYRGADLDAVLADNMRRFVLDPARNRIDRAHRTLALSRIFDWYAADFGGAAAVPAYVGRFAGADFSGWNVTFLDYDWRPVF